MQEGEKRKIPLAPAHDRRIHLAPLERCAERAAAALQDLYIDSRVFSIGAASLYACAILTTDRLTHKGDINSLTAGIVQVATIGVLSLIASCIMETPRLPQGGTEWLSVLALAVVCSGFGFTLQPVAQAGTTAERAGMFCALNPLVASVLGVVFLHERIGGQGIFGAALILSGILLSYVKLPEHRIEKRLT